MSGLLFVGTAHGSRPVSSGRWENPGLLALHVLDRGAAWSQSMHGWKGHRGSGVSGVSN